MVKEVREDYKTIEEVRTALFQFRHAINEMFKGEDCMEELGEYHHPDFVNYFGNIATNSESVASSRQSQLESFEVIADHYKKFGGAAMTIPWHKIFLRSPKEALVVFEICQAGPFFWDRSFVLHVWRKRNDGQWQIYRMFTEQEGRKNPAFEQLTTKSKSEAENELLDSFNIFTQSMFNGDGHMYLDVKHIEMKSETEGVICYHKYIVDEKDIVKEVNILAELWEKQAKKWTQVKVI